MVFGALPGEMFMNADTQTEASALAKALFGDAISTPAPSCPLCGGTTFRFLGEQKVQCQLCSNKGAIRFDKGMCMLPIYDDG
jgi:hypothetical protein